MPLLKKARRIDQQVKDRGARVPWTYQAYSVQISLWRLPANVGFREGKSIPGPWLPLVAGAEVHVGTSRPLKASLQITGTPIVKLLVRVLTHIKKERVRAPRTALVAVTADAYVTKMAGRVEAG